MWRHLIFQLFSGWATDCPGPGSLCDAQRPPAWRQLLLRLPPWVLNSYPGSWEGFAQLCSLRPKSRLCSLSTHAAHSSRRMNHSGTNEGEFGLQVLALVSKHTDLQSWNSTYTATPLSPPPPPGEKRFYYSCNNVFQVWKSPTCLHHVRPLKMAMSYKMIPAITQQWRTRKIPKLPKGPVDWCHLPAPALHEL